MGPPSSFFLGRTSSPLVNALLSLRFTHRAKDNPVDEASNLLLPYILAAQRRRARLTHNEALRENWMRWCGTSVIDRDLAAPPASPAEGARYIIAASPTGAWTESRR